MPNDEFDAAKEKAQEVKTRVLEACGTPLEPTAAQDHFPFDDFDENV